MEVYSFGSIEVSVALGKFDDSELDLVVKSQNIPLGITPGKVLARGGSVGGFGVTIKEATHAENVVHWPSITLSNPNRREAIYNATIDALKTAQEIQAIQMGIFTMGLEVSRLPSWEIAEEIVKAIIEHSSEETHLQHVKLVASSPTQVSSFQFVLNNITLIE